MFFVLLAACARLARVHTVHTCVTLHPSQRQAKQMDSLAPLPETLLRWSCSASRKLLTNSIAGQECILLPQYYWGAWEKAGLSGRRPKEKKAKKKSAVCLLCMISQHQCVWHGFPSLLLRDGWSFLL